MNTDYKKIVQWGLANGMITPAPHQPYKVSTIKRAIYKERADAAAAAAEVENEMKAQVERLVKEAIKKEKA